MQTYRTELRVGDSLIIDNGRIVVTLEEKSGQRARLTFSAVKGVKFSKGVLGRTGAEHAARGIKTASV